MPRRIRRSPRQRVFGGSAARPLPGTFRARGARGPRPGTPDRRAPRRMDRSMPAVLAGRGDAVGLRWLGSGAASWGLTRVRSAVGSPGVSRGFFVAPGRDSGGRLSSHALVPAGRAAACTRGVACPARPARVGVRPWRSRVGLRPARDPWARGGPRHPASARMHAPRCGRGDGAQIGSKRFAATFLRTVAGSQMRPFIAM